MHYYRFYGQAMLSSPESARAPSHLGVRTADGRKLILYDGLRCADTATLAAERGGGGLGPFELFDLRADARVANLHAEMVRSDPDAVRRARALATREAKATTRASTCGRVAPVELHAARLRLARVCRLHRARAAVLSTKNASGSTKHA